MTHVGKETDKKFVSIKQCMVESTHQEAVAWFMLRYTIDLFRQPVATLKIIPLCPMLVLEKGDA